MLSEILSKLTGANTGGIHPAAYLGGRFSYLFETFSELFPTAWLALYLLLRKRTSFRQMPAFVRTGAWIALLCYLPYWISPESGIRYLLPIYPLFALVAAGIIRQAGEAGMANARRWMIGMLALQLALFLAVFPYYQKHYRGENYLLAAQEIDRLTHNSTLYNNDSTSAGLIMTAYLNAMRYPGAALKMSGENWDNGFVITRLTDLPGTEVVKKFQLAADELYLLCRGTACVRTQAVPVPAYASPAS